MTRYWFINTPFKARNKLAICALCLALVVILLGAFTRLTNAGLSCPDWPHCYGFLTAPHTSTQLAHAALRYPLMPVDTKKAWTEMIHRYFAGSEGLLILVLAGSILVSRKAQNFKFKFISVALIALLALQISLGMLTVTEKLKPVIVVSHLLTGLSILGCLWWACLELHYRMEQHAHIQSFNKIALWIGFLLVCCQISLGGWVSTHYAGLACVDLPYCNGNLIPTLHLQQFNTDLITIHMLHRIGAVVTATYLLILSFFLQKKTGFRGIAYWLCFIVCLQLLLGVLNILWLRPVSIALIHHAVAILLLLTTINLLVKASLLDKNYAHWST